MATAKRRYPRDEFARLGDAMYESVVGPHLKPSDKGKFVAIDIESGEYEIDGKEDAACDRLHARIPGAQVWMVRVGYRYVRRFGTIHSSRQPAGSVK